MTLLAQRTRVMCTAVLLTVCLPAQSTDPVAFMDSWGQWSRDVVKRWQAASILHGNDLPKCRDIAARIETNWNRLDRSDAVDKYLTASARERFRTVLMGLIDGARKKKLKDDAQKMLADVEARYAAFVATKKIEDAIAKDLESLRMTMQVAVNAWKPPEPKAESRPKGPAKAPPKSVDAKKAFNDEVEKIATAATIAKEAAQWEDEFANTLLDAISGLKEYIESL